MALWERYSLFIIEAKKKKMTQILSEDEINQLLDAINAGAAEPEEAVPASRTIKIYDFKRAEKFSKEQIRAISIIHETFARLTSNKLSAQLRSMVHLHVASVDELTYEKFILVLPTPTTMAVIDMEPLKGGVVLKIEPAITFAVIDRICSRIGRSIEYDHELTEIENFILSRRNTRK